MKTPAGTLSFPIKPHNTLRDLTGKVFGRLTVKGFSHSVKRSGNNGFLNYWITICECGKQKAIIGGHMVRGASTSCGCKQRELTRARSTTHGESCNRFRSHEYGIWCAMLRRCRNKNVEEFARYGGRGISVCDRWTNSYQHFLEDMGRRPSERHSIDRINNDGDYEPSNCRWATPVEQARNSSRTTFLTHKGKTLPLSEWSEIVGIKKPTIAARLNKGWTVEAALCSPLAAGKWKRKVNKHLK